MAAIFILLIACGCVRLHEADWHSPLIQKRRQSFGWSESARRSSVSVSMPMFSRSWRMVKPFMNLGNIFCRAVGYVRVRTAVLVWLLVSLLSPCRPRFGGGF